MRLKIKPPVDSQMTIGSVTKFSATIVFEYMGVIFQWLLLFSLFCAATLGSLFAYGMHKTKGSVFGLEGYVNRSFEHISSGDLTLLIIGGLAFFIGCVVMGLYTYGLFIRAGLDKLEGVKRGMIERTKLAFKEGIGLFGFFIILFITNLLIQAPYLAAIIAWDESHEMAQMLIYLVCVVVQLLLYARLAATVPSIMQDKMPTIEAMKRSWALTKGQVFRIFGYKIVNTIVSLVYMIPLVIMITIIVVILSAMIGIGSFTDHLGTLMPVLSAAVFVVLMIYIFTIGVIYMITYSCDAALYDGLLREKKATEALVQTEDKTDVVDKEDKEEEKEYKEEEKEDREE